MRLASETMKVIHRTFDKIIDLKMASELQENAQVDVNIENFLKVLLTYLREICLNPHIRLRSTMTKYLSGLEFIVNLYNEIEENESTKELSNLYSDFEEIKMLKDTIVTTQVYAKELIEDLKDIQLSSNLGKIHYRLPGAIWIDRIKIIKEELLRVKEISLEKE